MDNLVENIDNQIESLTKLKRAINKFNRNSDSIKLNLKFNFGDTILIRLNNSDKTDYNNIIKDEIYCTMKHGYNCCIKSDHYSTIQRCIFIDYNYYNKGDNGRGINDNNDLFEGIIRFFNHIFSILNHGAPKKSQFEEHCGLASELVAEWPQWKRDAMRRDPYTYEPPDPQ